MKKQMQKKSKAEVAKANPYMVDDESFAILKNQGGSYTKV
jgi:hypothetical protein